MGEHDGDRIVGPSEGGDGFADRTRDPAAIQGEKEGGAGGDERTCRLLINGTPYLVAGRVPRNPSTLREEPIGAGLVLLVKPSGGVTWCDLALVGGPVEDDRCRPVAAPQR